jgi:hypothetical protein
MTEYAMAKAAGEILCADITRYLRGVRVFAERLPRVTTDQTASLMPVQAADPISVMLPIIRKIQHASSAADVRSRLSPG